MKKLIVIVALALAAITANAQAYIGGGVNLRPLGGGAASITVSPEIGYALSATTAVGAIVAINSVGGTTQFALNPYYRYGFKQFGKVMLFTDAEIQIVSAGGATTFGAGIAPGAAMQLNDHISLVARFGQVGYYNGGFTLSIGTALNQVTLYYHF